MKNLLTYVNPRKSFTVEDEKMVKVQIDNSLNLGWRLMDIKLVTNFPYEYNGVKAIVVEDKFCCDVNIKTSKINIIIYLLEYNILNDFTWVHDLDSFQLTDLDLPPLDRDIGFVDYCYNPLINTGNIFFKTGAIDIFKIISSEIERRNKIDELVLPKILAQNMGNINSRFRRLNVTYNIGMNQMPLLISHAEKPLKIAHFPPNRPEVLDSFRPILSPLLLKLLDEEFAYLYK